MSDFYTSDDWQNLLPWNAPWAHYLICALLAVLPSVRVVAPRRTSRSTIATRWSPCLTCMQGFSFYRYIDFFSCILASLLIWPWYVTWIKEKWAFLALAPDILRLCWSAVDVVESNSSCRAVEKSFDIHAFYLIFFDCAISFNRAAFCHFNCTFPSRIEIFAAKPPQVASFSVSIGPGRVCTPWSFAWPGQVLHALEVKLQWV